MYVPEKLSIDKKMILKIILQISMTNRNSRRSDQRRRPKRAYREIDQITK